MPHGPPSRAKTDCSGRKPFRETTCPAGAPRAQPQEALDPNLLWEAHLMLSSLRSKASVPPSPSLDFWPEPLLVPRAGGRERTQRIPVG